MMGSGTVAGCSQSFFCPSLKRATDMAATKKCSFD